MNIIETKLNGCVILEPSVFGDNRGYFFESYHQQAFNNATGTNTLFVQDNQSFSSKNVVRGLHAQSGEYAQAKLVRVLQGEVIDVAVDVRLGSSTFGQHVSVKLSAENKRQLFVPRGFLHGFIVLSNTAEFFYKCDNYYDKVSEYGVVYNDTTLNIDWGIDDSTLIVSEKDLLLPSFKEVFGNR